MPRHARAIFVMAMLLLGPVHAFGQANEKAPSFVNDVQPLLTRLGCNQGACHGKGAGQNGFRLSLRGYAPEWDHAWITREFTTRRINPTNPENSLLLQKPTGIAPHEGGVLMTTGSREYNVLLDWIRAGTPNVNKNDPALRRVEILPVPARSKPSDTWQLKVRAEYSDGETKDVTWLTKFHSNDEGVAKVTPTGLVTIERAGETAIRAMFQGQTAVAVFTAPRTGDVNAEWYAFPNDVIDTHVFKKLSDLRIEPSDRCDDATFLRRVYLDTMGILPEPSEVRAFLADKNLKKRAKLIDDVLARPEFVDFWTMQLNDLLMNRKENDHDVRGIKGVRNFHAWLREQVAKNRPWDELTRELLTVTGDTHEQPAIGYFVINVGEHRDSHKSPVAANVAQTFLGVRIGCAECHNHPLEKYTQDDYYHFAGYFSRIRLERKDPKIGPTKLTVSLPDVKQNKNPIGVTQPRTGKFMVPQVLDRTALKVEPDQDPRKVLADWITDPKNDYFAGAMVNRLWAHFFNVGLVTPVDDLRESNPPTNPELWRALVKEFVASKYDRKHLMRLILNSRAYQLSSKTKPGNEKDQRFYSHYYARRLQAEVLQDAISTVTGLPEQFEGYPLGLRAVQIPHSANSGKAAYFLQLFGRPERVTACTCDRANDVNLSQALHMLGGDPMQSKLQDANNRLAAMMKSKLTDQEIGEELIMLGFSRPASAKERQQITDHLNRENRGNMRRWRLEDIMWAVINTKEFSFNH